MNIFLDCEFTGLTKDASLISLALYVNEKDFFYAEFNDFDRSLLNEWLLLNVIDNLEFNDTNQFFDSIGSMVKIKADRQVIVEELKIWLSRFDTIEIWGDVPHYDWVLFCDLFGGALNIPANIHYICRDIATLLLEKNSGIDITRTEFVKENIEGIPGNQHNALFDTMITKLCYEKLLKV